MAVPTSPLRVLFLTLEFSAGTFSGNGVYAQSQVRALRQLGHQVFVISAAPTSHILDTDTDVKSQLIQV